MKKYFIIVLFLMAGKGIFSQNVNISNGNIYDGEPFIAVNPVNPQNMVVAWMGYLPYSKIYIKTRATFNGGKTWSAMQVISHVNSSYGSADPSMAFDDSGNVSLSFVDYNKTSSSGAVFVVKSTDGGLSWSNPVQVINANFDSHKPIDRPWISIDRSGGNYSGNIYITTIPPTVLGYLPPPYHPYLTLSSDGGSSFNQSRYLDTLNWLSGNVYRKPMATNCVAADGTFYAVYPSYVYSQNSLPQYIIASSDKGGAGFSYHTVFTLSPGSNVTDSLAKKGYLILADPSNANHLAFVYLSNYYGDADVFIRETFDKGATWGNPVRVNDDPVANNRMQDLLWGDFDDNGNLVIAWRDRRNGSDSTFKTAYEIWAAYRDKDSLSFGANFRISDTLVPYDTVLGPAGNDFMCVKLANDTLNAVWADTRNGKLNIWFQRTAANGAALIVEPLGSEKIPLVEVYPNPTSSKLWVKGKGVEKVLVYNSLNKLVKRVEGAESIDLKGLPDAFYFLEIFTEEGVVVKKIVKGE